MIQDVSEPIEIFNRKRINTTEIIFIALFKTNFNFPPDFKF